MIALIIIILFSNRINMKIFQYCSVFFLALVLTSSPSYRTAISGERIDVAAEDAQNAGDYIDDAVITTKVKAADDRLSALEVNSDSLKGVVQLSGFVDSHGEITQATEVV